MPESRQLGSWIQGVWNAGSQELMNACIQAAGILDSGSLEYRKSRMHECLHPGSWDLGFRDYGTREVRNAWMPESRYLGSWIREFRNTGRQECMNA